MATFTYTNSISTSSFEPDSMVDGLANHSKADLPDLQYRCVDASGNKVTMTLSPEAGITTGELTKIVMLSLAVMADGGSVNPLSYVKKHNLERHFKYS